MSIPDFPPGAPCWIDLLTRDLDAAKSFYSQLFGWNYEVGDEENDGGYLTATKDGLAVAGLMSNDPDNDYPDVWSTYLRADDIGALADKAEFHGGQVYLPPVE
ncbi:VOC family protein, partial [Glutamicibacter ardleyensis]